MIGQERYLVDGNELKLPPGKIDMSKIGENERRHRHRFYEPPETVYQWLLDQQRRAQAARKRARAVLPAACHLLAPTRLSHDTVESVGQCQTERTRYAPSSDRSSSSSSF